MRATSHGLRTKVRSLLLVTIMVIASVGHAGIVGADHADPIEDEVFEATENIDVWEHSIFTLRTDTSNAAMEIDNADWQISDGDSTTPIGGKDPIGVFESGTEVTITFDTSRDHSTADLSGTEVQLVAARLDESGEFSTPTNVSSALDLLNQENVNDNATFDPVGDETIDSTGEAMFRYTPEESGTYVFFLATSESTKQGFEVDSNGDISVDGNVAIVGLEEMMVRKSPSDVTPDKQSVKRGNDVVFDASANDLEGDNVSHLVVLYDEEKFVNDGEFVLNVSEDPNRDFDIQNNSTIEHSISHVNGVARLEEGFTINGIDVSDDSVSGSPGVGSVLDFIAENANTSVPKNDSTGDIVLDASATGINGSASESLTVETRDDWTPGVYRWVHLAVGEDSGEIATDTGEIQVAEHESLIVEEFKLSKKSVTLGNTVNAQIWLTNPNNEEVTQYAGIRKFISGESDQAGKYGPVEVTLNASESRKLVSFPMDTGDGQWGAHTYDVEAFVSHRNSPDDPIGDSVTKQLTVNRASGGGGTSPGGGGGGGGGSTGPPPAYSEVTPTENGGAKIAIRNGRPGEVARTGLSGVGANGVSFDQLDVEFSQDVGDMDLEITPSSTAPSDTPALPGGASSLSFLVVTHSDNVDDSIGEVTFRFTVEESQLPDGKTLDDVALYRYNSGEWSKLETSRNGNSFTAVSPGFSVFAVGTDSGEADISVTDASVSASTVDVGDSVTVTATLENTGEQEGSFTAEFTVDGTVVAEQEVTVPAGESAEVEFTHTFEEAGTYELAVSDTSAGTVTVQADDGPPGTETTTTTPPTDDDGLGLSAIVVLILLAAALVAGGAYYLRREGHI